MPPALSRGPVAVAAPLRSVRALTFGCANPQRARRMGTFFALAVGAAIVGNAQTPLARSRATGSRSAEFPSSEPRSAENSSADGAVMSVKGRILDAEGHPVANERVRLMREGRAEVERVTLSALDGSFLVERIARGSIRVHAGDEVSGKVVSALLGPGDTSDVVLVLGATQEISGVVLDERGAAVRRARLRWFGQGDVKAIIGATDDQGRYSLRRAEDRADRLAVWAHGFDAAVTAIEVGPSVKLRRDVWLHRAPALHGVVLDPAGRTVAGARISACQDEDVEVATSDDGGAFELPASTTGCWVNAHHARFAKAMAQRIADTKDFTIRMSAGGAIDGTVVDARRHPVASFSISIVSAEGDEAVSGLASRAGETMDFLRGTFRIEDLAPGTYILRASAEGKVIADSSPIKVTEGKVIHGEQLVLVDEDSSSEGLSVEHEIRETTVSTD